MSSLPATNKATDGAYRVMVVDDSAVIRGLISRWLEADPEITVVATAANGVMALRSLVPSAAEVVILDVEMPEMDGMTALPRIIEAAPHVKVIMASTLTRRNAEISVRAMEAGAADYIPKPESTRAVNTSQDFRTEVLAKVKALGRAAREGGQPSTAALPAGKPDSGQISGRTVAIHIASATQTNRDVTLRRISSARPRVMVVGSSTGGPQALFRFLGDMQGPLNVPILITQHMPATFTTILAEHLARNLNRPCREGQDGMPVEAGNIYLAPGNHHMVVVEEGGGPVIHLNQDPPENYCRPSVNALFRSAARVYGPAILAVMLTGMGSDGLEGSRLIAEGGGTIVAQDRETSVVWGMPGAVTSAGLASVVAPLDRIGGIASQLLRGERP